MKKKFEKRLPKTALNVVRKCLDGDGYQVFQIYGGELIPLLRVPPAKDIDEAFNRLYTEYYA